VCLTVLVSVCLRKVCKFFFFGAAQRGGVGCAIQGAVQILEKSISRGADSAQNQSVGESADSAQS